MRPLLLALAIASTLFAGRASAQAGSADAALAQLREQVMYAQYPDAIAVGTTLLARTDLAPRQRNAALELVATAQLANRQADDARRTLALLYSRDPGHRLTDPDASPPVVSAFARAREAQPATITLALEHTPPGSLARREPPQIEVRAGAGADAIDEMRLAYRFAGDPGYSQVVMNRRDGVWTGRIPVIGSADRAQDVAYYLVAIAPSGAELGGVGSESEPLQLRIAADAPNLSVRASDAVDPVAGTSPPPAQGRSIAEEPAFWIVLGLVLVGAAVGTGVGVALSGQGGPEQGTLGTVTLMH